MISLKKILYLIVCIISAILSLPAILILLTSIALFFLFVIFAIIIINLFLAAIIFQKKMKDIVQEMEQEFSDIDNCDGNDCENCIDFNNCNDCVDEYKSN